MMPIVPFPAASCAACSLRERDQFASPSRELAAARNGASHSREEEMMAYDPDAYIDPEFVNPAAIAGVKACNKQHGRGAVFPPRRV